MCVRESSLHCIKLMFAITEELPVRKLKALSDGLLFKGASSIFLIHRHLLEYYIGNLQISASMVIIATFCFLVWNIYQFVLETQCSKAARWKLFFWVMRHHAHKTVGLLVQHIEWILWWFINPKKKLIFSLRDFVWMDLSSFHWETEQAAPVNMTGYICNHHSYISW